ncbi:T9SS type A sorting domain-containing protein [Candidatus Fermentibacteria bacterium]|nr:T9SS type A sorting domain-containing protein [Candidatus Fermentibacteria bacterium]
MRVTVLFILLPLLSLHASAFNRCGTYLFHEEAVRLDSLWGKGPAAWAKAGATVPRAEYFEGDTKTFYSSIGSRWLPATLRLKGTNCYLWAEDALWGSTITMGKLQVMRTMFDDSTAADPSRGAYAIDVEAFGSPPDIDNDHRIHILVLNIGPAGVGGYFRPANEYPSSVEPTSNELDMFYYDDDLDPRASAFAAAVPAHEFQHMINWNQDANEDLWINEGCSGLAELLVGYLNAGGWAATWAQHTDGSLLNWEPNEGDYFATALFAIYLYDHFGGTTFTRQLLAEQANGIAGIQNALAHFGFGMDFRELFARWSLANLLDNPSPSFYGGVYGYEIINLPVSIAFAQDHGLYPVPSTSETVAGWGVDYVRLRDGGLMQWAATGPNDQWRRLDVLHVRYPFSDVAMQVVDHGSIVDTLIVSLDRFGADWDPEVMVVLNTSPTVVTLTYQEFTLVHPDAAPTVAGWPATGLGMLASSPVVCDNLVAVSDRNGAVHLLSSSASSRPGWPIQLPDQLWATPTMADLDGNGLAEIIVGTRGAMLHVFNQDGTSLPGWPVSFDGSTYGLPSPVAAADLDGDGLLELIAASFSGELACLKADGSPLAGWPLQVGSPLYSSPALGDLDGDGLPDIAVASMDSMLHVFDTAGQERPGWPKPLSARSWSGPVIGMPVNGIPAVLVSDEAGMVHAFDSSGTPLPGWPVSLGSRIQSPMALADLNGDGASEVMAATLSGVVHVLSGTGVNLPGWPRATGGEIWGSPVLADIDGDDIQEVAVASKQGKILICNADGSCADGWPLLLGSHLQAGPAVADLDGDGSAEIVLPGLTGIMQAWAVNVPFAGADWPQTGRNAAHTSSLLDPDAAGKDAALPRRLVVSVYPVPADREIMANVLNVTGSVRFELYALSGRRLMSRLMEVHGPVTLDTAGLGSGTYMLRVRNGKAAASIPVIVVN